MADVTGLDRRDHLRGVFLCMKVRCPVDVEQGAAICEYLIGLGSRSTWSRVRSPPNTVVGLSKSAALDYAALNIR